MARPVFYRIHEAAIASFNAPGQPVYNLIDSAGQMTETFAKFNVRSRTGRLRRNIRANRPKPHGPLRLAALVSANIGYALYVHEGTPRIWPGESGFLFVPRKNHRGGPINPSGAELAASHQKGTPKTFFLTRSVDGQRANPFLREGMQEALAKHPNLTYTGPS